MKNVGVRMLNRMELTISDLFRKYLDWCQKNGSARTAQWYEEHRTSFLARLGDQADLPLASLKPYHVVEWVDSHDTWGDTIKRGGIVAVQRACNWAEQTGYIDVTPLKRVAKPPARRRDNPMAPDDFQAIVARIEEGDPFRDLFLFLWHTGARPQEARHIEPRHVDLERAVVVIPKEEVKGKRYPRFIHLHGPSLEIVRRLMGVRMEGKLFRNTRGQPWSKFALCNRMYRLSRVAGVKKTAYDMRHGFATRKLVQGHDHLTIAELTGHRDGTMLAKVYAHLDRNDAHLKKALEDCTAPSRNWVKRPMEKCDDYAFGLRVMLAALAASVPVWIGLLIPFTLGWPLFAYLVSLGCTIPPALTIIFFVGRKARCPRCGQSILVNWRMPEFNRGGMLRYVCKDCNVEWATHLIPGGYTD